VSAKCDRSVQLLGNLSGERVRWAQGSKDFDQQLGASFVSALWFDLLSFCVNAPSAPVKETPTLGLLAF
jgi:hypothetical protein